MLNSIQSYVDSLKGNKDHLILMVENGNLITKTRKEVGYWTLISAKLFGAGPASFKKVCQFIQKNPDGIKLHIEDSKGLQAWESFKTKVLVYNQKRVHWKKAYLNKSISYIKNDNTNFTNTVEKVKELSRTLALEGKKLALFVGHTTDDVLYQTQDTVRVSLDKCLGKDLDPSRIHLLMNFNDREKMRALSKLFNQVIVDDSVLKFIDCDPWRYLGQLLKDDPNSFLITETHVGFVSVNPNSIEEANKEADEVRGIASKYFKEPNSDRCIEFIQQKTKDYLSTIFSEVKLVKNQKIGLDYFILKGPIHRRLKYNKAQQEARAKKGLDI